MLQYCQAAISLSDEVICCESSIALLKNSYEAIELLITNPLSCSIVEDQISQQLRCDERGKQQLHSVYISIELEY